MSIQSIPSFLTAVAMLRAKVSNTPTRVLWMARNETAVGSLAWLVDSCYRDLTKDLLSAGEKFVLAAPDGFARALEEYRTRWAELVSQASNEWTSRQLENVLGRILEDDEDAGVTASPRGRRLRRPEETPDFDLVGEDPSEAIEEIFYVAEGIAQGWDDQVGDNVSKALKAWAFYTDTVGLDLAGIARRWKLAPITFIPGHVSAGYGRNDARSLLALLDEANRAFVFGLHRAAIALCRAVLETVLTRHYGIPEDTLKNVITLAERRHGWMTKLRLQKHRLLANGVLHDAGATQEKAVLEFLQVVKTLIEQAPPTRQ